MKSSYCERMGRWVIVALVLCVPRPGMAGAKRRFYVEYQAVVVPQEQVPRYRPGDVIG
jgi:hypothetical protein